MKEYPYTEKNKYEVVAVKYSEWTSIFLNLPLLVVLDNLVTPEIFTLVN